ncbi:cation-translocating P-type ATPase [Loigolactobacillus bifermentans]|uniref:Cation-transporting ATPase, E1-E2 family protein n=1 Tax=Loigolactobacillus bifermentans DSM 20003 TaxID=1423726 RepID=A0A0R1H106_9LACO|nr:cation-transporting P-type ATPase [Loigolactobacillus bifermentans]KRK40158.1 cation-transporting ATPase, E1-E2 family protein [Loigolactobacillus bifermentans DSM 20003]QGG60903.1 HAD-IC family P-type ATPase [Loigolactobacillus bifermentans]
MFYDQTEQAVLTELATSRHDGLTKQTAEARLREKGPNQLNVDQTQSAWLIFVKSLKEPLVIILWIAVGLALLSASYDLWVLQDTKHGFGGLAEAGVIFAVIMINAGLTYWQGAKARRSLAALQSLAAHQVSVLRDGNWQKIAAEALVPGDIVEVKLGDFIEGDLRWLAVHELQLNESHLTGESEPVAKTVAALADETTLAERTNMGFAGSSVTNGSGLGVVTATGMATELGQIAQMLQAAQPKPTPIEQTVARLTRQLMLVALGVVVLSLSYDLGKEWLTTGQLTLTGLMANISGAIALAVAAIPDALPVVLSIVLTIGARLLAQQKGLIKALNSVETLGATTIVASDKTGTLTKNEMTVTHFWANGQTYTVEGNGYDPVGELEATTGVTDPAAYQALMQSAVLNNGASLQQDTAQRWQPFGNPTDIALMVLGEKAGYNQAALQQDFEICRVLPFDSTRKMMSTVVRHHQQYWLLTKGAPDVLLERADHVQWQPDQQKPMAAVKATLTQQIANYGQQALRTLAVAQRPLTAEAALNGDPADLEQQLTLLGILGIIDPPRPEVKASVAILKQAGVKVVMITGDHATTAQAIAYQLGIIDTPTAPVITGPALEAATDAELTSLVQETCVYARVTPQHKQRIVQAMQAQQEVVAMTGDGVNDAPALRSADIGIAMGINGTEVTKDAADLILLDDQFTTIEHSVAAGRRIFANIKNFMRQELTTNVAEVLALLLTTFLITQPIGHVSAMTPTLTTIMVLWVNMISDSLPSLALGYDQPEQALMQVPPRNVQQSILADHLLSRVLIRGGVMGGMVFGAFLWAAQAGLSTAEAQTVAFLTLVFGQLWHVFDARSQRSLFRRNPFQNRYLVAMVLFAGIASVTVTLVPFCNTLMGTRPLSSGLYLAVFLLPALPTFLLSGLKEIFRIEWW